MIYEDGFATSWGVVDEFGFEMLETEDESQALFKFNLLPQFITSSNLGQEIIVCATIEVTFHLYST